MPERLACALACERVFKLPCTPAFTLACSLVFALLGALAFALPGAFETSFKYTDAARVDQQRKTEDMKAGRRIYIVGFLEL